MIDPANLAEWRALAEKATPGPWRKHGSVVFFDHENYGDDQWLALSGGIGRDGTTLTDSGGFTRAMNTGDAAFIAAARIALPALLDEVERLREPSGNYRVKCLWDENAALRYERDALRVKLGMALDTLRGISTLVSTSDLLPTRAARMALETLTDINDAEVKP